MTVEVDGDACHAVLEVLVSLSKKWQSRGLDSLGVGDTSKYTDIPGHEKRNLERNEKYASVVEKARSSYGEPEWGCSSFDWFIVTLSRHFLRRKNDAR